MGLGLGSQIRVLGLVFRLFLFNSVRQHGESCLALDH